MNNQSIKDIFKSYNKDNRKVLFPNGENEVETIIASLALICDLNPEDLTYIVMKDLTNIYVDSFIKKAARVDDVDVVKEMVNKHSKYVKDIEMASKVMAFILLHFNNPKYQLKNLEDEELNETSSMYLDTIDFMEANKGLENKFVKDKEYGLVKEKPIYTHGQTGSETYFSVLINNNHAVLRYEFEDTLEVENINGFVDVYRLLDSNNKEISKLYINPYGNFNSNNAPKGFKLKKVEIEKIVKDQEVKVVKKMRISAYVELAMGIIAIVVAGILLYIRNK